MSFSKLTACSVAALCACTTFSTAFADVADSGLHAALSQTKPILDLRLRYEGVDQDGFADNADALTYRLRAGLQTGEFLGTSFLVEFDHIGDIVDDFNSTTNGKTMYPVVPDPEATELNRLQLTNKSFPDTAITLGRQRVILDDSRFVGNVGWRQNEQTFDGLRVQNDSIGKLKLDFTYLNQVNRIFGDESAMGRWEGDVWLANASYPTPFGSLTGFGYLLDIDDAGGTMSSETYGVRLAGARELGEGKLSYAASYANQKDYGSSPFDYSADYYLIEGDYSFGAVSLGAGYEVLGGDDQRGFQTPLATLHKFQGWADKFLVTPVGGVEDIYAKAGYKVGDVGPLSGVSIAAIYHDFSADEGGSDYGSELDLSASGTWDKVKLTLKFADYQSDGFASDTQKIWLQLDFAL